MIFRFSLYILLVMQIAYILFILFKWFKDRRKKCFSFLKSAELQGEKLTLKNWFSFTVFKLIIEWEWFWIMSHTVVSKVKWNKKRSKSLFQFSAYIFRVWGYKIFQLIFLTQPIYLFSIKCIWSQKITKLKNKIS